LPAIPVQEYDIDERLYRSRLDGKARRHRLTLVPPRCVSCDLVATHRLKRCKIGWFIALHVSPFFQ